MYVRSCRSRSLASAIATLLAGAATAGPVIDTGAGIVGGPDDRIVLDAAAPARYFVQFKEAPLALYDGSEPQLAAIPRTTRANGRRRLDPHSAPAQQYLSHLAAAQAQHLQAVSNALGRVAKPLRSLRHVMNAAVLELTPAEAAQLRKVEGVSAVRAVGSRVPATDLGPQFIGASWLWTLPDGVSDDLFHASFDGGTPPAHAAKGLGDGIVVGDIDTGYNSLSPSFAAVDDTGYAIQNPLGAGNYLGQCGVPGISLAGCNNKVIGLYDEITDDNTVSVEDTQGHGSHTASTAAGNSRAATLGSFTTHIAGVAPHANLVVYYGCAPAPKNCPDDALTSAVEHAVADGVVDVINYSISGGFDPWGDPTSQAFLAAENAGIFIAAAGGNTSASTPEAIPGTVNHFEPWVLTVAAANHNGGAIGPRLSITGPGTPPAATQDVDLSETLGDTPLAGDLPGTTAIRLSPQFHINDIDGTDGCAAYPANTFQNAIALISRGTCSVVTKVANAYAAGAVVAVIADNRPEGAVTFSMTPVQPIPAYAITQASGAQLRDFLAANNNAGTAAIPHLPTRQSAQPDQLAGFSLLGPALIDVVKPEVQAPGTNILAAVSNDGSANGPGAVALLNGTSMATPHTTGAGALLSALHPDWTPMEIKSALMMTAKEAGLTKPDGTTPSDYFDRGAGRIAVDLASRTGLVMDESATRMQGVNPALGGDAPGTLNLASMQNASCSSGTTNACTFTRTFRSTQNRAVTWTAQYSGDPSLGATMQPASFTVTGPGIKTVDFHVDATALPADGHFHFGEATLTPSDATLPTLHLPLAIGVQPPAMAITPASLDIAIAAGGSTAEATLSVANVGGPTLAVDNTNLVDAAPGYAYVALDQSSLTNYATYSSYFTDYSAGQYAADDFTVTDASTDLGRIRLPGFMTKATALSALTGHLVHFRIYRDAGGKPDGAPEAPQTPPNNAPVWQFDRAIGQAGLDVSGDTITLDLTAAGAPSTHLAPGTYWMVIYPEVAFGTQGGWAAFLVDTGSGAVGKSISPTGGAPNWTAFNGYAGIALHLEQKVACGAPWFTTAPASLNLGGLASAPVTVSVDSSNFGGGNATEVGYLCLHSNDANRPVSVVRVSATQH